MKPEFIADPGALDCIDIMTIMRFFCSFVQESLLQSDNRSGSSILKELSNPCCVLSAPESEFIKTIRNNISFSFLSASTVVITCLTSSFPT